MTVGIEQLKWAAQTLGFELTERALRADLVGSIDGQRVAIEQIRGSQFIMVDFHATFDPPGDLHLAVTQSGALSKIAGWLGQHDIQIGDAELDAAFTIKAHDEARARALFTPEVCAALRPWKQAGDWFNIDDKGVHFGVAPGAYSTLDGESFVKNARAVAHLARTMGEALRNVPASSALAEHVPVWRAFADEHRLSFMSSPLRVAGALTDPGYRAAQALPFVARAVPVSADTYGVELRVGIEPKLPFDLRVRPAHWYDFAERTGEATHQKTGDAAFDETFRVTTTDRDAALTLLGDHARAALLELHRDHFGVELENDELAVRTRTMIEPDAFAPLVARVASALR